MNRFDFNRKLVILPVLTVAFLFTVMACGNNRSGLYIAPVQEVRPNSQPGASCVMRGAASYVFEFTGHTHGNTVISAEDIISGLEKAYATPATDSHNHGFVITAAQFDDLQASVIVNTTTYPDASGHGHPVSIYCY